MPTPLQSLRERSQSARRAVFVSIAANAVFAGVKIVAAILGRSHALLADGIESLLDILSSGLVWGALKYGAKPPDELHPYGHGKIEPLAGIAASLLFLFAGLSLGYHSFLSILFARTEGMVLAPPSPLTLLVLVVVIAGKETLFRFILHHGRKSGSTAMQADAWHHRSDALTSLAALIGIGITLFGGPRFSTADSWAALFSCVIILFNGVLMLRKSIGETMDERVSEQVVNEVYRISRSVPGVLDAEKCRVRKSGLSLIADLHIKVNGEKTVSEGHEISHKVKDRLLECDLAFTDITVHIEPAKPELQS
ncbi:MAG: cation diffusion facilitator family transporter [Chthoniobacterales bacterium]